MEKSNTDYVLKTLRKISFPLPRISGRKDLSDILMEVEQIEESLKDYRRYLESKNDLKT
jgi:hypothetical protein